METKTLLKLQNGSDVRGIACEGIEGESVNLTPQIASVIAQSFASWLAKKTEKEGKYLLDLALANKYILLSCGIPEANIDVANLCTCENSELLHSHRATAGKRGNLAAIIEIC